MKNKKSDTVCPVIVIATFITIVALDHFLHTYLIIDDYYLWDNNWTVDFWATRGFIQTNLAYFYIGSFIFSIFLAGIFKLGYEGGGVEEGIRFGVYIGIVLAALRLSAYPYHTAPVSLIYAWCFADLLKMMVVGAVIAKMHTMKCKGMVCETAGCTVHCEMEKKVVTKKKVQAKKKK